MSIFKVFINKPVGLFITAATCECNYIYSLMSNSSKIECIKIDNVNSFVFNYQRKKNVLFFAHGDDELRVFYKKGDNTHSPIYIQKEWWQIFSNRVSVLYFHVCNGSLILRHNPTISKEFGQWISYSEPVSIVMGSSDPIKSMNQKFIHSVCDSLMSRKTIDAILSDIKSAYFSMMADIHDLPNQYSIYEFPLRLMVGQNIESLKGSNSLN